MRFLRAVCGRIAALCGEKKGCTPTRDAASRAVDPLPPQSTAAALPARFLGFGAPNVSQNHAPCTVSKRVGFAKRKKRPHTDAGCGLPGCSPLLPLQSAATACALRESGPPARFPGFGAPNVSQNHAPCTVSKRVGFANTQKRLHPDAGCGLPGCSPLLPLQSAAAALPARFLGFGAPNVSQNHAPCTVSKRVGFAKRKKGRTPARDAASALSFRRWRCFGCGSCGRRCRRGRPAPRACRTRRCARPG